MANGMGLVSYNNNGNLIHFIPHPRPNLLSIVYIIILFIEPMMHVFNIQEKSDWIIYNRYIQRDLELCKLLIDQELKNTKDNNEFAFYILVINRLNTKKLLFLNENIEYQNC